LRENRVTAGGGAIYVKPNDELAFARALAELMDDPAKRVAMGMLGRHRIETELAWRYSIPNLLGAYRKVLRQPVVAEPRAIPRRNPVRPPTVRSGQAGM